MAELKDAILKAAQTPNTKKSVLTYDKKIEDLLEYIETILKRDKNLQQKYPLRWLAIKLLEKDEQVLEVIKKTVFSRELLEVVA
jgi:ferrous iron transport protein B